MKVIFKTLFGSHLYGTDTPNSDKDYKAIFIESLDNIILSKDKHTYQETTKEGDSFGVRNTKDDEECEYIELRRFLKDAMAGQTYALDMLFSPIALWENFSSFWMEIVDNKEKLLSKKLEPYIGYCRQQAGKYGLKGSRLAELLRVINHLKQFNEKDLLGDCIQNFAESEFVSIYEMVVEKPHQEKPMKQTYMDILGKKFSLNTAVHKVLFSLEKMNAVYGDRAKLAMENKGVDFKAVSHAFRCCYQLKELTQTGRIEFPLKQAVELRDIKLGKIPYLELGDKLYELMEEVKKDIEKSILPDEPDKKFWEEFILKTYKKQCKD